jgi:hypothetical protein
VAEPRPAVLATVRADGRLTAAAAECEDLGCGLR